MPARCPKCKSFWVDYRGWADPTGRRCQACGHEWTAENDTWQVGDGTEGELVQRPWGALIFDGP